MQLLQNLIQLKILHAFGKNADCKNINFELEYSFKISLIFFLMLTQFFKVLDFIIMHHRKYK